jgi:Putative Flp pilus-assembly TadE/G-like
MIRRLLGNQRGTAVLLTLGFMIFLLAMVGFAVDLAYQMVAIGELERSMEAAALAGAGKLGFNDTVFPTVRQWARQYGQFNTQHNTTAGTTINLDLNTANAPSGNIVLGVWDGAGNFAPSVDGTIVNAVRCQFASQVQTSFLRVLGINTLPISASAIAVANPPQAPPPPTDECLFPIGIGSCPFQGENSSIGCGAAVTFITSSKKDDGAGAGCLAPPCTNTAAWVNLAGSDTPTAEYLKDAITAAGNGACAATGFQTNDGVPVSNGMVQSAFNTLEPVFVQKYTNSSIEEIKDADGNVTYSGKGWKVYVPVIETDCPAGAISGTHTIKGWTEFVMTQVINHGKCAVNNDWGGTSSPWAQAGTTNGCNAATFEPAMRAIFGYYSCKIYPSNPVPIPTPRTALGSRLRLVKMYQ